MNKVSKTDAAYIAGFFDGEGCIRSDMSGPKRGTHLHITIAQKRLEVLYWLEKTLGYGRVRIAKPSRWEVMGNKLNISHFIKTVLPFSIVKKEELKVGLKLSKLIGSRSGPPVPRISNSNYQNRIKLTNELRRLKHAHVSKPIRSAQRN